MGNAALKHSLQCQQAGCDELATARFDWPGQGWREVCGGHALQALRVADAMGFALTVEAMIDRVWWLLGCGVQLCRVPAPDQDGFELQCTHLHGHHGRHSWAPFDD